MKKIFVKWAFTDDYGCPQEENYQWFNNEAEAEAWKTKMKKGNGSYFYVYKTAEGDFAEFERMNALMAEVARLKAQF